MPAVTPAMVFSIPSFVGMMTGACSLPSSFTGLASETRVNSFGLGLRIISQACRDAQDAKRDVQVPLLPSLIT
ncbi:MAG: hypothetical protein M3H12_07420, partial [Chromatiales bacterium]